MSTQLHNGQLCRVVNTNSRLDGELVTVTGRVTDFGMMGDIYIIKKQANQMFMIGGQWWECMALTNACLTTEL